jgi:hypothetical protein
VKEKKEEEPVSIEERLGIGRYGRMTIGAVLKHKMERKLTS